MAKITSHDGKAARVRYEAAEPKQFGNLHERMKYLMKLLERAPLPETHTEVHHAIWDLLTEVQSTDPIDPPFGRRPTNLPASE